MQVFSNGSSLVPPLTIDLNQTECMCLSMETLAGSVDIPVPTTCQRTSVCNGVNCILTVPFVGMLDLEVTFEACQNPPRVQVVVKDSSNNALLNQYFNGSDTVVISTLIVTLTLDVVIENDNYSMIIQVCIVKYK